MSRTYVLYLLEGVFQKMRGYSFSDKEKLEKILKATGISRSELARRLAVSAVVRGRRDGAVPRPLELVAQEFPPQRGSEGYLAHGHHVLGGDRQHRAVGTTPVGDL